MRRGAATAAFLAFALALLAEPIRRPNILLIVADDLGYGDVGVLFQNQRAAARDRRLPSFATPRIDTLARDGHILRHHYAAAPVCAPSRASLLTGRTQGHASVRDNQFDHALSETLTVAAVLRQAGYATAAIGKWGLQGGPPDANPPPDRSPDDRLAMRARWTSYPTQRGFDYFLGSVRHRDGHFHYPAEDRREIWENDREISAGLELCYTTDLFTAGAKRWITARQSAAPGQPFFLYLAYDTPHAVLAHPPCAYPEGGGLHGGVQWTGRPGALLNTATGTRDGWIHPDIARATWDHDGDPATAEQPWPDIQRRHANGVRRIDDAVGDLLQLLADLHLADDTLVIFTSDNGPAQESYLPDAFQPDFFHGFGPFDGLKRDLLEGGVRVPALVRWPAAIPSGTVSEEPTGQWDWLATLADAAGLTPPASSDGVSLLPTLTGRGPQPPGTLYSEYFSPQSTPAFPAFAPAHRLRKRGQMQMLILEGYKGLRYDVRSADDDFTLHDLRTDPQEAHNLALRPEFAALQARMKAQVLRLRRPDPATPRPYDTACVPPVAIPERTGTLAWARFAGPFPWLPDVRGLTPERAGTCAGPGASLPSRSADGVVQLSGFIRIPADDTYTFALTSDADAMLFLHDIRVLDATAERLGTVRLGAGWHPLRFLHRESGSAPAPGLLVHDGAGRRLTLAPADFAPPLAP